MDDFTFSGETSTALDPGNPALAAATAEYQKVMTDPTHPHHAGLKRGDKLANAYIDNLYRKAVPNTPPIDQGVSITTGGPDDALPTLSPEDAQAGQALQQEWSGNYACNMLDAQFGVSRITRVFGGEADDLISAVLAAVDELPPEIRSQVGGLKFVTNIARHFGKQARTYAP